MYAIDLDSGDSVAEYTIDENWVNLAPGGEFDVFVRMVDISGENEIVARSSGSGNQIEIRRYNSLRGETNDYVERSVADEFDELEDVISDFVGR